MKKIEGAIVGGLILASLAIILSTNPLAMYDASSHLSTTVVLRALLEGDAFYGAHYSIEWIPVPYWLTTAFHLPLTTLFGPWLAMQLLVAGFAIALPLGWRFLSWRTGASSLLLPLVVLAVFSHYYWSGVTNFLFGQALIAPALAFFYALRRFGSKEFAALVVILMLAYFAHVFVLASILGACGLAWTLAVAAPRSRFAAMPPTKAHFAVLGLGVALFGAAAWFIFGEPGAGANTGQLLFDWSPHRLGNLFESAWSSPTLESPLPALAFVLVAGLAWLLPYGAMPLRRPRAFFAEAFHLPTLAIAIAFGALYFFGPVAIEEAPGKVEEDICPRFALTAFLLALASLRVRWSPPARYALLAVSLLFAAYKLNDTWRLHRQQADTYAAYRSEILERIPERSRILPILADKDRHAPKAVYFFQFLGNYVVPERHGYSPNLYGQVGQQFLRHVPPGGGARGQHRDIYDRTLTEDEWGFYDYLVVQTNADVPDVPGLEERTERVSEAVGFQLYRVRR